MKTPRELLFGETYSQLEKALKMVNSGDVLTKKQINHIKGALLDASFLYPDAASEEMYGFMSVYSELINKWERRNNV